MKMQAAIVEAALAISVLVLSSAAIAAIVYDSTNGSAGQMQQANAAYDLFRIMQQNSTYEKCIYGAGACPGSLLAEFRSIYGLSYIRISAADSEVHSGSLSECASGYSFCEPIIPARYGIMCVYACT